MRRRGKTLRRSDAVENRRDLAAGAGGEDGITRHQVELRVVRRNPRDCGGEGVREFALIREESTFAIGAPFKV
jgi:hypothetical protein